VMEKVEDVKGTMLSNVGTGSHLHCSFVRVRACM
jgi:hypothetical protein